MENDFSLCLNFSIVVQSLFSFIYFISLRDRQNRWLTIVFASTFSLHLGFLISDGQLPFWQKLFVGNPGVVLWIFPCIYFFTVELVSIKINRRQIWWHFLPGGLFYIVFLFADISHPKGAFLAFAKGKNLLIHLLFIITVLSTVIYYAFLVLKLVQFNQQKFKNEYAESSVYITLDWLKYLFWGILVLAVGGTLLVPLSSFSFMPSPSQNFYIIEIFFLLSMLVISFFAFRQPILYQTSKVDDRSAKYPSNPTEKSKKIKPVLSDQEIEILRQKIERYFEEHQPFLEQDIRMSDIAKGLQIKSNVLSWYLNEHCQLNFFRFINRYRVEYASLLLQKADAQQYTLEAIGKMSGFRSKTTFNNRFREIMEVTPSAFRKAHKL